MGERGSERERAGVRKRDLEMEDVIKPTEERDEKERKEIEGGRRKNKKENNTGRGRNKPPLFIFSSCEQNRKT